MSTVLDRTAADTIMEQAIAHAEVGKNFFLRTFKHVPENKLNWCPAPTSKSALRIAAHVALGNSAFASILRGEKPPFTSMEAMYKPFCQLSINQGRIQPQRARKI